MNCRYKPGINIIAERFRKSGSKKQAIKKRALIKMSARLYMWLVIHPGIEPGTP